MSERWKGDSNAVSLGCFFLMSCYDSSCPGPVTQSLSVSPCPVTSSLTLLGQVHHWVTLQEPLFMDICHKGKLTTPSYTAPSGRRGFKYETTAIEQRLWGPLVNGISPSDSAPSTKQRGERYSLPKGCKRTCRWQGQAASCKGTCVISGLWPSKGVVTWATGSLAQGLQSFTCWCYLETPLTMCRQWMLVPLASSTALQRGYQVHLDSDWEQLLLTPQRKKTFVYQCSFPPHSPAPNSQTRMRWLGLKMTVF